MTTKSTETITNHMSKRVACSVCGQTDLEWVKTSGNHWFYVPFGTDDLSGSKHALRPENCRKGQSAPATPVPSPVTVPTDLSGVTAEIQVLKDNDETLRVAVNELSEQIAGGLPSVQKYDDSAIMRGIEIANDTLENLAREVEQIKANAPTRVELVTPMNAQPVTVHNPHPMFLNAVTMLNVIGNDGVLALVGEAGSRKTTAVQKLAEACGFGDNWETYPISIDTVKSDILGYRNGLTGDYVEGVLFRGYTKPQLTCFDEFDKILSGIATVLNGAFANVHYGFPHGMFERDADSRFMVAMNTFGRGPDALYNSGQQLDGATLDRLVYLPWNTDWIDVAGSVGLSVTNPPVAEYPAPGRPRSVDEYADWGDYVLKIHNIVTELGIRVHVGGRALRIGAKLLAAGIDRDLVEFATIWGHMASQDADTVKANL